MREKTTRLVASSVYDGRKKKRILNLKSESERETEIVRVIEEKKRKEREGKI